MSGYGANWGQPGGVKYTHPGDAPTVSAPDNQIYNPPAYGSENHYSGQPSHNPPYDQSQSGHHSGSGYAYPGQQNTNYNNNGQQYGQAGGFAPPPPSQAQYPQQYGIVHLPWLGAPPSDQSQPFRTQGGQPIPYNSHPPAPQGGFGQPSLQYPASLSYGNHQGGYDHSHHSQPPSDATAPPQVPAAPAWPVAPVIPVYPQHQPQIAESQGVPSHLNVNQNGQPHHYGQPYNPSAAGGNTATAATSSASADPGTLLDKWRHVWDRPDHFGDNQLKLPDRFEMPFTSGVSEATNNDRSNVWASLREHGAATLKGPDWWTGNWLPAAGREYDGFRDKFRSITNLDLRPVIPSSTDDTTYNQPANQHNWSTNDQSVAFSGTIDPNVGAYSNSAGQFSGDNNTQNNPPVNWY